MRQIKPKIHWIIASFMILAGVPSGKAATALVSIGNFWFSPTNITINAGDTVMWSNAVTTAHDTTSSSGLWASSTFTTPNTFSFKFSNTGYYPYICAVHIVSHPEQTGTVSVVSSLVLPPAVAITSPTNGTILLAPATFNISATASDSGGTVTQVQFFNGATSLGTVTTSPYTVTVSSLAAGKYTLSAVATSSQGTKATNSVSVVVDAPPAVSITSPSNGATLTAPASFTLSANASDSDGTVASVQFFQGTTSLGTDTSSPYSVNVSSLATGNYTFSAIATDNLGAKATNTISLTVGAANVPPTVSITSPTNGTTLIAPASFSLSASASDSDGTVASVQFFQGTTSLGTDTSSPYSVNVSSLATGSYTFSAVAIDNLGAKTTNSINLVVDAPPTVAITSPTNGAVLAAPATFTVRATASDADGSVAQVQFFQGVTSLGTVTSSPFSVGVNSLAAGNYTLSAVATDNLGAKATNTINLTVGAGPSVLITAPTNGTVLVAPATLAVSATASDSSSSLTQVQFFQGTTSLGVVTSSPYSVTVSSLAAGAYTFSAVASDSLGAKATNAVNVVVDAPPTVSITSPTNGATFAAPSNLTLTAAASDTDGSVAQVQFFQGSTSLGVVTSSPYSITLTNLAAGSYTLSAVATDNLGVSTTNSIGIAVTTQIQITAPAIIGPTINGNTLNFSFATQVGLTYTAQFSSSVNPFNWQTLTNLIGDGTIQQVTNASLTGQQGYFRVVVH